jgi:hypothetical protein
MRQKSADRNDGFKALNPVEESSVVHRSIAQEILHASAVQADIFNLQKAS